MKYTRISLRIFLIKYSEIYKIYKLFYLNYLNKIITYFYSFNKRYKNRLIIIILSWNIVIYK